MQSYALLSASLARVEPGDWDWTAFGTIATAVAAVVTAITIIFVAKQTRATAKAAKEAQRSADAAHRALDHSQTQLEYSHQQHQQSLYMATEAVKARIDADMPRLSTEDIAVLPGIFMGDDSHPMTAFSDPGDRTRPIAHRVRFTIRNDGPRTAKLLFSHPLKYHKILLGGSEGIQLRSRVQDSVPLGVGEALVGELTLTSEAGYWMDVAQTRAAGKQPDSYPQFSIRYLTDADTGAHENHTVILSGEALKQDPNQRGLWHPISTDLMNGEGSEFGAFAEPVRRFYFSSRVRNEALPELPWESIAKVPNQRLGVPEVK